MKILHIIDYRRRVLATLSQEPNGRLRLDLYASAYEKEFSALLSAITASPLPLHTYERIILPDADRMVSKTINLLPSDPDFLWAVSEYLKKHPIGDTSVFGQIVNIPAANNLLANHSQTGAA